MFIFLYQRTPIHMAAKSGDKNIVEHLVDKEADIEIMDDTGVNTELISCFWFQYATPVFTQPALCGFTLLHLHLCTWFVEMLLDHVEPETGNDFHLISKSSEKGAAFIHAQLFKFWFVIAISHNLLIKLIHFETIMLQIMCIKDYADVEKQDSKFILFNFCLGVLLSVVYIYGSIF